MNELRLETIIQVAKFEELTAAQKELVLEGREAVALSHSPYSKFRVGCAIRLDNGKIIRGANQENASYPICLCAEGTALASIATQYPGLTISDVAIFVPISRPASPCGLCRQSFKEYEYRMKTKYNYILASNEDHYLFRGIDAILPLAFDADDLE
jgi:cytidine deaminase